MNLQEENREGIKLPHEVQALPFEPFKIADSGERAISKFSTTQQIKIRELLARIFESWKSFNQQISDLKEKNIEISGDGFTYSLRTEKFFIVAIFITHRNRFYIISVKPANEEKRKRSKNKLASSVKMALKNERRRSRKDFEGAEDQPKFVKRFRN